MAITSRRFMDDMVMSIVDNWDFGKHSADRV
jgi:hypothetical protein